MQQRTCDNRTANSNEQGGRWHGRTRGLFNEAILNSRGSTSHLFFLLPFLVPFDAVAHVVCGSGGRCGGRCSTRSGRDTRRAELGSWQRRHRSSCCTRREVSRRGHLGGERRRQRGLGSDRCHHLARKCLGNPLPVLPVFRLSTTDAGGPESDKGSRLAPYEAQRLPYTAGHRGAA